MVLVQGLEEEAAEPPVEPFAAVAAAARGDVVERFASVHSAVVVGGPAVGGSGGRFCGLPYRARPRARDREYG